MGSVELIVTGRQVPMKSDEKRPYVPPEARLIRFVPRELLGYIGDPDEELEESIGLFSDHGTQGSGSFEEEFPED